MVPEGELNGPAPLSETGERELKSQRLSHQSLDDLTRRHHHGAAPVVEEELALE